MSKKPFLLKLMNFWGPFIGSGIHIKHMSDDMRLIEVEIKLRPWNKNYVGTHFGGSIYAMTDPFYMLMLMANLGSRYIVWDKSAEVRFLKPGKGTIRARFELDAERIEAIRQAADTEWKTEPLFLVQVTDNEGNVIAEVDKVLYVRRKDRGERPKN